MAVILDSNQQRVYRSLSGTRPTRTVVMVTNPYRYESKLLKSFLGAMRKRPESEQKVTNRRNK